MRYYSIEIEGGQKYTSFPNGRFDPEALLVELDICVVGAATPSQGAYVKIWGVGLQAISQARDLFGKKITVRGGMGQGLPLAKPSQAGVLASGMITKSFGHWEGVDQSLDLIFSASSTGVTGGANPTGSNNHIVLNWRKGQQLGPALQQALSTAFPKLNVALNIGRQIVAPMDQIGFYPNLEQLAQFVARFSQQIVGGNYQGVSIVHQGDKLNVSDGNSGAKQIAFTDLVGQPTWIGPQTIQFKNVMRADIEVLDKVTLPPTFINSTASGAATAGTSIQQMAFQGKFQIVSMRHVGNSRAPSGDAWVTIFEAAISQ